MNALTRHRSRRSTVMAHSRISLSILVCLALCAIAPLAGQVIKSDGPKPQFEVASVRPNKSGEAGASLGPRPGGRLIGTNQTVRNLIRNAFNVQPFQLIGGPDWIDSDRFDINAKSAETDLDEKGMLPYPQFMLRLQALLEDRFEMVTHWETRELPVYALVLATRGRLGPKLKEHAGDCDRARGGGPPVSGSPTANCGTRTNVTPTSGKITGTGIRMETFARNLSGGSGRYIVDKTGLMGSFDLELEFTPDQSPDTTGPSLFTAMQEQLGLKLDSQRAPVEVVVIEKLERPSPD
jgi:uncharacterized protein (TIGR03435 family)